VRSISLHWSVPLSAGGICLLVFPLWMYGARGVDAASGWQLGLDVLLYYPPTVVTLFFFGWLHRWVSRKADRPKIAMLYLLAAHACLGIALITVAVAIARILTPNPAP
jgi:hypothetical protein